MPAATRRACIAAPVLRDRGTRRQADRAGCRGDRRRIVAHLAGLVGANVRVTLEIEADVPDGVPEHVVRTVTVRSPEGTFSSS
jgi:hypothetical protein